MSNKSLLNKFLSFSVGSWITFLIGIISTPIITRMFSPVQFGIYSQFELYSSLVMIILVFGIDQAFVRFFYAEKEENRKLLLLRCVKIPAIINILLIILAIIFREYVSKFIFGSYNLIFLIIIIVHVSFLLINRFALLVVRMQQKSKTYSLLIVMNKVFYLFMIFIAGYYLKDNYMALVLALLFSNVAVTIMAIICEREYWNIFNIKDGEMNLQTDTKEILVYGAPLVITAAIHYIFQSADRIAIQSFWGAEELGIYSSAAKVVALLTILQGCFTTFWVPVAFERYEKNPEDVEFFEKASLIVTIAMFFCTIGLILFRDIIILFLGSEYRTAAYIIPFLSFMPIMYTVSETTVLGINFKKKQRKHIYISVVSCVVNIIGNFILVPKLGAVGAGISTGLSYIVFFSIRTYIGLRYYKVNYHLKRFYIMTFALCIYTFYATFFKFGYLYILLGILELLLLYILYRKYINALINMCRDLYKKKIKR
ncbi:lipopolysaccharide biosynthesis protein [Clostridium senegalense]|uniref:Oligosaccharide flippase family protein n=1 Tax=Clostridium senegalense TaxID=1465809 RepID=A0A6M0GZC8_9CLOT|nr:oligosaccharide flippase family protein [Clostridium senegalense]NEU03936.1 oligosaccharide flippase family protein [Clostridium senegalense]